MLFDGGLKVVSISTNANDFSLDYPCQITQEAPQQPVQYAHAAVAGWYQCGLVDGNRYYVNIKPTLSTSDPYTMTVR